MRFKTRQGTQTSTATVRALITPGTCRSAPSALRRAPFEAAVRLQLLRHGLARAAADRAFGAEAVLWSAGRFGNGGERLHRRLPGLGPEPLLRHQRFAAERADAADALRLFSHRGRLCGRL